MSNFDFDLFVIGGGSGGVRAARIAAGHGAKVALAEEYRMGGTCVIRGCVPKKLMVYASGYPEAVREAQAYGWDATIGAFDWEVFHRKLEAELDRLEGLYRKGQEGAGVTLHDCRATVAGPHEVRLADGRIVSAKHILVAVGGKPFVPEFEGCEHVLTSNDMFKFKTLPKTMLIVGGGYIACEFACILNGLGVEVSLLNRSALLRGFDAESRDVIVGQMERAGVRIRTGHVIDRVTCKGTAFSVHIAGQTEETYDAVLYATGRVPLTEGLGLEEAGVKLGQRGEVLVDEWSQTNVPSIFAVGDVTDRIQLTPVAIREGHAFADTVFGANPRKMDHDLVASAVFTQPEFGTCGVTEEEAAGTGADIYTSSFRPMKSLFAGNDEKVFLKLVVDQKTQVVTGCHIVGPDAGEMIQMVAIAMKMGATKAQFDATCAVHPTMAEELVTMRSPTRSV
ncbi:glutathione-disulfide reductase [Thioclava sp. GXIMD4216]|uniref:Glutathione-disulfide reductase n=1 Tax=Thioclava litoralis TaxID=3076557 RepID=A0ABZ1DZ31_9RHOB|nr:glutathione-disulfide reductase [Thioclava sp. FTW29]